jgi:hypothetical protein
MRRAKARGDIGAGAEAGVEQAHRAQPVERGVVQREALGLEDDLAVPAQPEPFEIGKDRGDMLGPAPRPVDILDPEQEHAPGRPREIMRLQRGPGVAQMEPPGGAWRESRNDSHESGS